MEYIISWTIDNKEWLFSGAGVIVVSVVCRWLFRRSRMSSTQNISAGDGSINIQTGRDANIGRK